MVLCALGATLFGAAPRSAVATVFPEPASAHLPHAGVVHVPAFSPHPEPEPVPAVDPVVYRDLHPVRDPFLMRWQQATAREMSGSGASPWYRDLSTRLDVTWRLAELAPTPVTIAPEVRDQAFNMAIAGSYSGWSRVWNQTFARSPELVPIHTAIRSTLNPSLQIRKDRGGRTRVSSDAQSSQNQSAAMADINQGPVGRATTAADRPSPFVRTGSMMTLVRLPNQTDLDLETPRANAVSPELTSWIDVRHVGVDAARIQSRVQQNPDRARFRPQVRWTALARQGLLPTWDLVAELQGSPENHHLQRNAVALEHRLVAAGLPTWALRLSAVQQVRDDLGPNTNEDRLMLTVRNNLAWHLPQDVERWPLGQRPLAPGPTLPSTPPSGPENPRPLAQQPVERNGMPLHDEDGLADH